MSTKYTQEAMTGSIILTESNLSPNGSFDPTQQLAPYNTLSLNLRGLNLHGRKIGLKKLNLYYSWPNIRSATTTSISWRIGATYTPFAWTLPALTNYESISVLNQALQSFCIANGLYLIDSSGNNVFYLELKANPTTYKIDLLLFEIPSSLPSGWTQPSNFVGYPTATVTARFTIPAGSELGAIIGFAPGTYDGTGSDAVFSSTIVPQLSPVSSIFITCNVCKNDVPLNGSTVLTGFTTRGTPYGAMIEVIPNEITFYEIDTNTNDLVVQLLDQNYNGLYVQEAQMVVHLEVA